jgi:uncharacterized membrane protein
MKAIQFITGLLLVLVAGVFWGTWFSLSRTMHELPAAMFLAIGKEIMANVALTMSIIMPASVLCLLILLIGSWKTKNLYFYCVLATLVLFITALIITVGIEVPIDNQIRTWTVAAMPADWQGIRDRWEYYHTIRTFASLSATAFFLIALIYHKPVVDQLKFHKRLPT